MPMRLTLFDAEGQPLALDADANHEHIVDIREPESRLSYDNMPPQVMISAFRGFSAPIILTTDLTDAELARLMVCDSDAFNRWEAGQQLASRTMLSMLDSDSRGLDGYRSTADCGICRPADAHSDATGAGCGNAGIAGRKIHR